MDSILLKNNQLQQLLCNMFPSFFSEWKFLSLWIVYDMLRSPSPVESKDRDRKGHDETLYSIAEVIKMQGAS